MNILIVSKWSQEAKVVNRQAVPRVGDRIDLFYHPCPKVTDVLMYPSNFTLESFGVFDTSIEAVVTLD